MKICPRCKTELDNSATYCPKCGLGKSKSNPNPDSGSRPDSYNGYYQQQQHNNTNRGGTDRALLLKIREKRLALQ